MDSPRQTRAWPLRASGLLVAASLLLPPHLGAQDTGTITGRIEDAQSGQPISSVQVYITGLDVGVLTQQNGRYLLQNVPAGTHTVTAERIGYRTATRQVSIGAGETVVQNFTIAEQALQLDEVIVTGTPGGTQRRAIGNAVTRLDAEEVTVNRPVRDMQQMLQGRTPGLDFLRTTGVVGEGSRIQIRGISSFQLGTQPLIYVDGIRVDNSTDRGPNLPSLTGASGTSALDDLNPADIASIEVIKGPAAATLYGTEASAGVIQIITKRGETGAPQFDMSVSQGTSFLMDPRGRIGDQWGCQGSRPPCPDEAYTFNILDEEAEKGLNPLEYGHNQRYSLSVRGGTEAVTYYVSADWNDQEGIVDYNWDERFNARANLGILVSEDFDLDISTGFVSGNTRYASGPLETGGLWPDMMWAVGALLETPQRGYPLQTPEQLATLETTREYNRFTGSATLSHNPAEWFSHRVVVGIDRLDEENQVLVPRHPDGAGGPFGALSAGNVDLERPINTELSLDYSANGTYEPTDAFSFTTSVGLQYYTEELNSATSIGSNFPSTVIRSIQGATDTDASQTFFQNKSLGVYVQEEIGWNDRAFVTGAVRFDDNSAFGADFDAAVYPKVSGTWVVSEEDFWNVDFVNSLRLRTAWGKAGRQPSTFAAVTLFDPATGPGGTSAITPSTLGNPEIGPEVSSELEIGFDAAFFNDRFSTEFTYYTQTVKDALTSQPLSPTNGFPGDIDANLGQLDNWGFEVAGMARAFQQQSWALDVGFSVAYTMNEIKDLGGRPQTNDFREGFPFPARTFDRITSAETNMFGLPTNLMCDPGTEDLRPSDRTPVPCSETEGYELLLGPTFSPWTWSTDVTLTLFDDLQVFGMVDAEHGRWMWDYNLSCRHLLCVANTEDAVKLDDPFYFASVVQNDTHPVDDRYGQAHDASYIKLRELGARYQLPDSWISGIGADRASVAVAARDLWYLWVAQERLPPDDIREDRSNVGTPIPSPELSDPNLNSSFSLFQWPPLTSFEATLRVSF